VTVLPTVRRQLEQAAKHQATNMRRSHPAHRGLRIRHRRFGAGGIIAALGVIVAMGVAVVALVDHIRMAGTAASPAPYNAPAMRRLLEGNGIGGVRFGQPRSAVIAELERRLGPPHETIPGICGFGPNTDWIGLNIDVNSHDPHLSAQLTLNFKQSRFVGYAYFANGEGTARQRHGVLFATSRGLALGDTVSRARHLYGRAFVETNVPQGTPPSAKLPMLPVGELRTLSGEISAGIDGFGRQDRITAHSTVVSIAAGAGPNTPCR
jgi:hypothetical protein